MLGEGHSTSGAGPSDAPAPPPEAANWLHCPVCLSLILPDRKPTLVKPCDHMFCQECIAGAQARKRKADQKCPSCRGKIVETAALAASAGLHRVYLAEKVPCPYDCGTAVEISGLEGHYGKCEKLKCAYCGLAVIPPMTQEGHDATVCPKSEVLCDIAGCSESVKRVELRAHRKVCPKRIEQCRYPLCTFKGPFDSLDQHVADSTQEHLLLSLTKLSEVSDRLDKTNGILTKTMNALAETAEEVGALKRQLAATCTKKIRIMIGYKGSKPPQALPYDSPISSGTVTTGSVLYNSGTVWFSGVGFVVYLSIKNKETWCFHLGLSDEEGANNGQPTSVKVKWMVDVNSGEATYVRRALYAQLVRGGQFIGFAVDQQITALLNSGAVSKDSVNEVLYLEATVSVYVHSVKFGTKPRSGTKSLANGLWPDAPF